MGDYLTKSGLKNLVLHGDKAHSQRTKAVTATFKENSIRVLVATDIASRGLDIEDLPHVINYELPRMRKITCTEQEEQGVLVKRDGLSL